MRSHSTLIYNLTGQQFEMQPPYSELILTGVPTAAASYAVYGGTQSNDGTPKFTGNATLDSVSTTVASASGYSQTNRSRLNLTSTANVAVGRTYAVATANGQREVVVVKAIGSGYVDLENDLAFDYAAADTFKGITHTATVDAAFIQDVSNINVFGVVSRFQTDLDAEAAPPYRVKWTYTNGGLSRIVWTYFDVARQAAKSNTSLHDLRKHFPDLTNEEWLGQRGKGFIAQLDAGWERLLFDIRAAGYDVDAIREGPMLDELHLRSTLMVIAEAGLSPSNRAPDQWAMEKRMDYRAMFSQAIGAGLKVWIDQGSDGSVTPNPRKQLRLRR